MRAASTGSVVFMPSLHRAQEQRLGDDAYKQSLARMLRDLTKPQAQ
jgi:hypothetical protein